MKSKKRVEITCKGSYSTISNYHGTSPRFGVGDVSTGSRDFFMRYSDSTLVVVSSSPFDINKEVFYAFDSRLSAFDTNSAISTVRQRPALIIKNQTS